MELYFLDRNFTAISLPVDTAVSVVWALRYHECGSFTVVLPLTEGMPGSGENSAVLLALASQAVYLCDRERCGRIETLICRDGLLQLEGRLLECLLYDRVASADTVYSGTAAEAVMAALGDWAEGLPLLVEDAMPVAGETAQYSMKAGDRLGKWIHETLAVSGASYTITMKDGRLFFALVMGTDRSLDSEPGVNRAIFSEEFGNIASLEEELYREDAYSRIYVEGGDGTVVTVDRAETPEERRESYKKAADLRPEDYDTNEAYLAALTGRGEALLDAAGARYRLSCIAEYDVEPRFGTDYGLGDICEIYSPATAVRTAARLTALDVVQEGGMVRLYPCFGDSVIRLKTALA